VTERSSDLTACHKVHGDGVLVYFGYPQAQEDDPEQALRAGLAVVGPLPVSQQCRLCKYELALRPTGGGRRSHRLEIF
jgi:hypothetical protein